jgi:hypothetical protein
VDSTPAPSPPPTHQAPGQASPTTPQRRHTTPLKLPRHHMSVEASAIAVDTPGALQPGRPHPHPLPTVPALRQNLPLPRLRADAALPPCQPHVLLRTA